MASAPEPFSFSPVVVRAPFRSLDVPWGVRRLSILLSLFLLSACAGEERASLFVDLRTDYLPTLEFVRAEIVLTSGQEAVANTTHDATSANYVAGQRIAAFDDLAYGGDYEVQVRLVGPAGDAITSRTVALPISDAVVTATVVMTRSCGGLMCPTSEDPTATECAGGRCVPPTCSPANPEACGPDSCMADGDCTSTGCAQGRCTTEGSCIAEPIAGVCQPTEACSGDGLCTPLPGCEPTRCNGDALVCTLGGVERETPCPVSCTETPTPQCLDLAVDNLDPPLSEAPTTRSEVFRDETWSTSTGDCEALPGYWMVQGQPDGAPELCVLAFDDVSFEGTHTVTGDRALMVVALGDLTVRGTFRADANAGQPGPGGSLGGEGPHVGGTSCARCGTGGGGGGTAGGIGGGVMGSLGGRGGSPWADYALVPLWGGSGGGGNGGAGGGAPQLVARGTLTLEGEVILSGGAGSSDGDAGTGGGSGGNLLLVTAREPVVAMGAQIYAAGAGGAGESGLSCGGLGRRAGEGEAGDDVLGGRTAICGRESTAAAGGNGGTMSAGTAGEDQTDPSGAAGGGGGGAGIVRVLAPASVSAVTLPGTGLRQSGTATYEAAPAL